MTTCKKPCDQPIPKAKLRVRTGREKQMLFSHLTSIQYSQDEMVIPTDTFRNLPAENCHSRKYQGSDYQWTAVGWSSNYYPFIHCTLLTRADLATPGCSTASTVCIGNLGTCITCRKMQWGFNFKEILIQMRKMTSSIPQWLELTGVLKDGPTQSKLLHGGGSVAVSDFNQRVSLLLV